MATLKASPEDAVELCFLARQIADDKQLTKVLKGAEPKLRKPVYELLKPLLNFKPKPYCLLKF